MAKRAAKRAGKGKTPKLTAGQINSLDALLKAVAGQFGHDSGAPDDLDVAQDIMWTAWDTAGRKKRIALARRALAISPLCADAHVMLAQEEAETLAQRIAAYRAGVAAGEKALGRQTFEEDAGMFWGILETRPYMRARHGLAGALWEAGERDEAIGHFQDMLRLNPNDNQGIRYELLDHLLELGRDREAAELIQAYAEDGSAMWAYGRALQAFRTEGDSAAARAALQEALTTNRHVPPYLSGGKALPQRLPDFYGMGDENEAIVYALSGKAAWSATPGAAAWLMAQAPEPTGRRARQNPRRG
jgi:tetratricopeptide (TPR) repeat protein